MLQAAQGNPLALLELPQALSDPQRSGREPLPPVLPLGQRLQELFTSRVARLPPGTRALLLLAALEGTGDLRVLPYVVGTPATYGFAGFNGRTLADNAPEAMLSLVLDQAVPSGLRPSLSRDARDTNFPYVVPA